MTSVSVNRGKASWIPVLIIAFWTPSVSYSEDSPTVRPIQFQGEGIRYEKKTRFSPDGRYLGIKFQQHRNRDSEVFIWDLDAGTEKCRLVGHEGILDLAFSPDSKYVVTTSAKDFYLWSVETGENLAADSHGGSASRWYAPVEFHPSGSFFGIGCDKNLEMYRVNTTNESKRAIEFRSVRLASRNTVDSGGYIQSISFSPDGTQVLCSSRQGRTFVFGLKSRTSRQVPGIGVTSQYASTGKYFAILRSSGVWGKVRVIDDELVVYDANSVREIRKFSLDNDHLPKNYAFRSRIFTFTFSSDGNSLYVLTDDAGFVKWNIGSGKIEKTFRIETYGGLKGSSFRKGTGEFALNYGYSVQFWRMPTESLVARLDLKRADGEWGIQTDAGYFNHSPKATPIVTGSQREQEAFLAKFHKPIMVKRILRGMSAADADALPPNGQPPLIALRVVETRNESATIEIRATARGDGVTIREIDVRVDGRPLSSVSSTAKNVLFVPVSSEKKNEKIVKVVADFPPGKNDAIVSAVAIDDFNQHSKREAISIERPEKVAPVQGRLFVLAVGVSEYKNSQFDLDYPDDDAEALVKVLKRQKGRAFSDVLTEIYTNGQATVTNVELGLDWLARSCTPKDVAVVLFSGHGIQKQKGLYYLTHEANLSGVQYTCVNWETVAQKLAITRAKQILFLSDTCYAGSFGDAQLATQTQIADSLKNAGVLVFASSKGDERSLESDRWRHGAFCHAILNALQGDADANRDKIVTIRELLSYVRGEVIRVTNDRQHPVVPDISNFDPNFVIARP